MKFAVCLIFLITLLFSIIRCDEVEAQDAPNEHEGEYRSEHEEVDESKMSKITHSCHLHFLGRMGKAHV